MTVQSGGDYGHNLISSTFDASTRCGIALREDVLRTNRCSRGHHTVVICPFLVSIAAFRLLAGTPTLGPGLTLSATPNMHVNDANSRKFGRAETSRTRTNVALIVRVVLYGTAVGFLESFRPVHVSALSAGTANDSGVLTDGGGDGHVVLRARMRESRNVARHSGFPGATRRWWYRS